MAEIENKLLNITQTFLTELGRERAVRALTLDSHFERDLGIDSLGRVELFHRIEEGFGINLPESLMAQAEKLADMVQIIANAKPQEKFVKNIKTLQTELTTYSPSNAQSLVEILINRAMSEPNRPHIYLQEEDGSEKVITYGELYAQALKVAGGLSEYNIEQGDTIAIMLPTCEDFFYTFFGVLLLGAIPVPIYPPFRPERIEEYAMREANILRNANARLLITFHQAQRLSDLLQVFISSLRGVTTVDALKKSTQNAPSVTITNNMPALIQYTSGSTSLPKGVLLSHQNLLANIRSTGVSIQISPADVGVSWLPLYHDMGLIGSWLTCFYHANPVVIMSPLSFLTRPERWLWAIHYHRGTLSAAPNFAYELCVRRIKPESIEGLDLSSWRLTFNGAEAVNPKTIASFTKKFEPYGFKPQTMFPVYGLAESSVALVFPPINREPKIDTINRELFEKEQRAVPASPNELNALQFVCCGKAIIDHEICIVDKDDNPVSERRIGYLHFRGPSSMLGYYQQPEATKAITHDGWLDSGDLAYLADGELYITGRKKDTIIKAGRNLYPEEIEEVTSQVSGVRKGCVVAFGVADNKSGTEKLVIVVETNEKVSTVRKKMHHEINEKIAIVLGFVPDEVILVPPKTIPKTSSGKLQRSRTKLAYIDKKLLSPTIPFWVQISKLYIKSLGTRIKSAFTKSLKAIYSLYVGLLLVLSVFLVWIAVVILSHRLASKWSKLVARGATYLMGCPITVENATVMPTTNPMVYVANHASYIDAVVMLATLPAGVTFVAKKELLKVPLLGTIVKKLKMITVDRVDFLTNLSDTTIIQEKLSQGATIVIFPEGTFTYATGLRPFKLGAFKVAVETSTPICPVAIKGTRNILRDDELLLSPGKIEVTIGKTITPHSKQWSEVIRMHSVARAAIAEHCGELVIDY